MRIIATIAINFIPKFKRKFFIIKSKIENTNKFNDVYPEHLIISLIEIEDKRFYGHLGIDFYSILRAVVKNITTKRIQGASTIVQQLVRNITEEREIKYKRKINEIIFAILISKEFSKKDILNSYLNTYKFNNYEGILDFCINEKYNINILTMNEAAQIAARFKYPSINKYNYIKYLKRLRTIEIKVVNKISKI